MADKQGGKRYGAAKQKQLEDLQAHNAKVFAQRTMAIWKNASRRDSFLVAHRWTLRLCGWA
jgi:hypothetical protein